MEGGDDQRPRNHDKPRRKKREKKGEDRREHHRSTDDDNGSDSKGLTSGRSMAQLSQYTDSMKRKQAMDSASHAMSEEEMNIAKGLTSAPSMAQFNQWTDSMKRKQAMDGASHAMSEEELNIAKGLTSAPSMAQFNQWTDSMKRKQVMDSVSHTMSEEEINIAKGLNSAQSMAQFDQWTEHMKKKGDGIADSKPSSGSHVKSSGSKGHRQQEQPPLQQHKKPAPVPAPIEEDYEEEFEDYEDEDFEDDDAAPSPKKPPVAPSKSSAVTQQQQQPGSAKGSGRGVISAKQSGARGSSPVLLESPQLRQSADPKGYTQRSPPAPTAPSIDPAERPEAKRSSGSGSGSRPPPSPRGKKFESMQISFASSSLSDPRGVRVQRIINSGVMDLAAERFTHWNVPSSTKYDLYMSVLRRTPATVRQIGVPVDLEQRDVECNTEPIETADRGVQFTYGDDTDFFEIMRRVKQKKAAAAAMGTSGGRRGGGTDVDRDADDFGAKAESSAGSMKNKHTDGLLDAYSSYHERKAVEGADASAAMEGGGSGGASQLNTFLQRASYLCETLLEEHENRVGDAGGEAKAGGPVRGGSGGRQQQQVLFDRDERWIDLGKDAHKGTNELVVTRGLVGLQFSHLQPHLIVSAHPFPVGDDADADLRPYKGLYSIWDVANPGGPVYVLEGTGQPTCCTFSSTQAHLVVGGTQEGSLHLWDLREHSFIHKDRDSIDLRIEKGIRKPSYSTNLSFLLTGNDAHEVDGDYQHAAPIVQVESLTSAQDLEGSINQLLSSATSVVSQFVSIDESGLLIFWVTNQQAAVGAYAAGDTQLAEDLQRSPWGTVMLVQTRQIHVHTPSPSSALPPPGNSSGGGSLSPLSGAVSGRVLTARPPPGATGAGSFLPHADLVMASVPEDLSLVLVSLAGGRVEKLARFGEPPHPHALCRAHHEASDLQIEMVDGLGTERAESKHSGSSTTGGKVFTHTQVQETNFFARVSCMAVRAGRSPGQRQGQDTGPLDSSDADAKGLPDTGATASIAATLSTASLVLVGRADGTIDLFQLDAENPVQSWSLNGFVDGGNSTGGSRGGKPKVKPSPVVLVRWCSSRAAVFFAADSRGNLFLFDLSQDPYAPIDIQQAAAGQQQDGGSSGSSGSVKLNSKLVSFSNVRPGSSYFYVATGQQQQGGGHSIRVRKGSASVARCPDAQRIAEEQKLRAALNSLCTVTCPAPSVTFRPANATAGLTRDAK